MEESTTTLNLTDIESGYRTLTLDLADVGRGNEFYGITDKSANFDVYKLWNQTVAYKAPYEDVTADTDKLLTLLFEDKTTEKVIFSLSRNRLIHDTSTRRMRAAYTTLKLHKCSVEHVYFADNALIIILSTLGHLYQLEWNNDEGIVLSEVFAGEFSLT